MDLARVTLFSCGCVPCWSVTMVACRGPCIIMCGGGRRWCASARPMSRFVWSRPRYSKAGQALVAGYGKGGLAGTSSASCRWRDNKTADPPLLASVRHAAHLAAAPPLYRPPLLPGLSCAFRLRSKGSASSRRGAFAPVKAHRSPLHSIASFCGFRTTCFTAHLPHNLLHLPSPLSPASCRL